jgi:hypothetical protein
MVTTALVAEGLLVGRVPMDTSLPDKWTAERVLQFALDYRYCLGHYYHSLPLQGYWKVYQPGQEDFNIYCFTDSAIAVVDPHSFSEYNKLYSFTGQERQAGFSYLDFFVECGGGTYEYKLQGNSLLLYETKANGGKLAYKAVRCQLADIERYTFFSNYLVNINPTVSDQPLESWNRRSPYCYIDLGYPQAKWPRPAKVQDWQMSDDHQYLAIQDLPNFVANEMDKLDKMDQPKLKFCLNADRDAPPQLLDSIRRTLRAAYPDLKLYQVAKQAQTGEAGLINWE